MNPSKIEVSEVKVAFCELKEFCYLSNDNDFIEVTKWTNGDGFNVCISRKNHEQNFSLTSGELDAVNVLSKVI